MNARPDGGQTAAMIAAWAVAVLLAVTRALDVPHALLLGGCVTVLALAWPAPLPGPPRLRPARFRSHAGSRRDVSDLSWQMRSRDGSVSPRGAARLQALARATGLQTLADAIGETPAPSPQQALRWLDVIDAAQQAESVESVEGAP